MFRFTALGLLLLLSMPIASQAQQGGDFQAQILYAYHTEDSNSLANLVQTLSGQVKANPDQALRYHLAHAQYRLGLLAGKKHAKAAYPAFSDCIDELKGLPQDDVTSADGLALQSACYTQLAAMSRLQGMFLRNRASGHIATALKLAPRNPRVVFIAAQEGLARAKPGSVDHAKAFTQLELAVQLFESSSSTRIDVPGWGHADAYLALGLQLQARGDVLGARNWIEKALIAAPDFKAAQRQQSGSSRR